MLIGNPLTAKLLAIAAAAAIAVTAIASAVAYHRGKAADRQRSDLVIKTMQLDAADRLAAANAEHRATSDKLQAAKEAAEHEHQATKDRQARRLADAVATDRLVRGEVTAFASGAGSGEDTLAACRNEAGALGDVFADSLQAHRICVEQTESEAAGARLLYDGWPVMP